MINKAMQEKLESGEAVDVSGCTREGRYYVLESFTEDADYCDAKKEFWIWSIGIRYSDGKILASTGSELYQNKDYQCIWLR